MVGMIIVAILGGLAGAMGVYALCTERERLDLVALKQRLDGIEKTATKADVTSEICKEYYIDMKIGIKEIEYYEAELEKLKNWCYGKVAYLPNIKKTEELNEETAPEAETGKDMEETGNETEA